MPENCFDQYCSCSRLELEKAYSGKHPAALANNSETPGISPTRTALHPSSSCASEISIPRDARRLAKNSCESLSPLSCRLHAVCYRNRSLNELLITASMPGPSGECSIEIDIDYHATEVKQ